LELNGYMATITIYQVKDPEKDIVGDKLHTVGSNVLSDWMRNRLTDVNAMEANRLMEGFNKCKNILAHHSSF
jgi:hypothetical protein